MKLIALLIVAACTDSQANPATKSASAPANTLRLEQVGEQFRNPVYLTSNAADSIPEYLGESAEWRRAGPAEHGVPS
jgi:hypothetical protein